MDLVEKFELKKRNIVKAYVVYRMTMAQIGEVYGITAQAIGVRMKRYLRSEMRRFALEYPDIFKWKYSEFMRKVIPEVDPKILEFLCEDWTSRRFRRDLMKKYGYSDMKEIVEVVFDKRLTSKRLRDLVFNLYDTIGGYTIEDDI